jgi:hypothetical protein
MHEPTVVLQNMSEEQAEAPAPARQADKIAAVIEELVQGGQIKPYHRDIEVRARTEARLKEQGCPRHEIPSKSTFKRVLPKLRTLWRKPG